MRGRDAIAVAFRHPDGHIVWASESLRTGPHGVASCARAVRARPDRAVRDPGRRDALADPEREHPGERGGDRARQGLGRAHARPDPRPRRRGVLPAAAVRRDLTTSSIQQDWVQHVVEGLVRVAIFLGYLTLISRMPDIRRVFEYHGAEHMTIHALEAGDPLDDGRGAQVPDRAPSLRHRVPRRRDHPVDLRVQPRGPAEHRDHGRQPAPADPGHRRHRLRDPQVRGEAPRPTRWSRRSWRPASSSR